MQNWERLSRRERSATVALFFLTVGTVAACGSSQAPSPKHVKSGDDNHATEGGVDLRKRDQGGHGEPVTNAHMEAMLRETIAQLPPNSGVQRIALADIGYPMSQEENVKLAGFTLFVVTAVTHDPAELPLKTVFFRHANGEIPLPAILSRVGTLAPDDLRKVFGQHRYDGLYVIPLEAAVTEGTIVANFQVARRDFTLLTFPAGPLPAGVEPIPPGEPDMNALQAFGDREFPIVAELSLAPPQ